MLGGTWERDAPPMSYYFVSAKTKTLLYKDIAFNGDKSSASQSDRNVFNWAAILATPPATLRLSMGS